MVQRLSLLDQDADSCSGDLDMPRQVVLFDDLAHVGLDLVRGSDRLALPGLEAIAERVEVAVGADARILVGQPGPPKPSWRLQFDGTISIWWWRMSSAANARNAGADDDDIEMLGLLWPPRPRKGYPAWEGSFLADIL